MYDLLKIKFSNCTLKQLLLETYGNTITELNSWGDVYWGVCDKTNMGHNKLGEILMKIRDELND